MSGFVPQLAGWDLFKEVEEAQIHLKSQVPSGDETLACLTAGFWFYACIHSSVFQQAAINSDVTVLSHYYVESCVTSLLLCTKTENRHKGSMLRFGDANSSSKKNVFLRQKMSVMVIWERMLSFQAKGHKLIRNRAFLY